MVIPRPGGYTNKYHDTVFAPFRQPPRVEEHRKDDAHPARYHRKIFLRRGIAFCPDVCYNYFRSVREWRNWQTRMIQVHVCSTHLQVQVLFPAQQPDSKESGFFRASGQTGSPRTVSALGGCRGMRALLLAQPVPEGIAVAHEAVGIMHNVNAAVAVAG